MMLEGTMLSSGRYSSVWNLELRSVPLLEVIVETMPGVPGTICEDEASRGPRKFGFAGDARIAVARNGNIADGKRRCIVTF